ncbi:MAG TPA: SRPBCC family protein [Kofleriaceae bacterium]|nr:SRPBCC family protein [Kofleriaceae bacterium]
MMSNLVHVAVAAMLASACGGAATADTPASTTTIRMTHPSSSVTEGEITVGASPDAVYAVLTDYEGWPRVFTYLDRVQIHTQQGDAVEIATVSKTGKTAELRCRNERATRTVRFEQVNGRAHVAADIAVKTGQAAGTASIRVRMTAKVSGALGWLVSDATIRHKREQKITKDLRLLQAYFENAAAVATRRADAAR